MIYTKNGDEGKSAVIHGFPTVKDAPVFNVLGTVDELSSSLGIAKYESSATLKDTIELIQKELILVSTHIAGGEKVDYSARCANLETLIDAFERKNTKRNGFSLCGETKLGALLDFSRTIARRLERSVVYMTKNFSLNKEVNPYFNRLSDLLYVMARYADMQNCTSDVTINKTEKSDNIRGVLNAKSAMELCAKVLDKARSIGLRAVCSVCNKEGNVISLICDDDAFLVSTDVAKNKAWTAAALKMSTKDLAKVCEEKDGLFGLQHYNDKRIVLFAGGDVLTVNGEICGGIGVSGGLAWQDEELCAYGKNLFERGVV